MKTTMTAPFELSNIKQDYTYIRYEGNTGRYFTHGERYIVYKVSDHNVFVRDEEGAPHTLSISFLNKNFSLVDPVNVEQTLLENLSAKMVIKDLTGMEEAFKSLREAIYNSIPKISKAHIKPSALFENGTHYLMLVYLPQEGYCYVRTYKEHREWKTGWGTFKNEDIDELIDELERMKYVPINYIPSL